jgi:autotransporter-associated beta strand protein
MRRAFFTSTLKPGRAFPPDTLRLSCLLALSLALEPWTARAQTVVNWSASPLSADWNTGAGNWDTDTVPGQTDTAAFGVSTLTSLTFSNDSGATSVGGLVFNSGAGAYTFTLTPTTTTTAIPTFGIYGAGVVNNSGVTQSFVLNGAQTGASEGGVLSFGALAFYNSATAGANTLITNQGGAIASTTNATNSGGTFFNDTSTAGGATIVNNATTIDGAGGGVTLFWGNSSAGNATVTNHGAASALGGPPGEGATFAAGMTIFDFNADAGNSTLVANGGANGGAGGTIRFTGTATGCTSTVQLNGNGVLELFGLTAASGTPSLTISSLAGTGNVYLGANNLTVGAGDTSTTFSGVIADGGNPGETGSSTATGGSFTKVGTGTLTLTGASSYTGGTTVSGGLVNFSSLGNFGSGPITLDGGGLQWASGGAVDVSPRLAALGSAGGTLDTNGNNVVLSSALSGSGALTKTGAGTLSLTAANTYGGGTTISDGTLILGDGGTTGSVTGNIVNNSALVFNRSNSATYAGNISGTGSLTLTGAGDVQLDGVMSYTGTTTIGAQTLRLNGPTLTGDVSLAGGALLMQNASTLNGALSGNGFIFAYANATGQRLTLASINNFSGNMLVGAGLELGNGTLNANITMATGVSSYFGTINFFGSGNLLVSGNISGTPNNVMKTGAGTVTLTGSNTFSTFGPTEIYAGALYANNTSGSALGTAAVIVRNGGLLGGTGSIGGATTFQSGAHLAPGAATAPGVLTFTNGLTLNDGVILDFRLGTTSDQVLVSGGLFTGPASEAGATLSIAATSGFTAGIYTLIDNSLGTLAGLDPAAFAIGNSVDGYTLALAGNANGGLDLIATATAIPEPATGGAMAALAVLTMTALRRKRAIRAV